jgi:hypothetical protein
MPILTLITTLLICVCFSSLILAQHPQKSPAGNPSTNTQELKVSRVHEGMSSGLLEMLLAVDAGLRPFWDIRQWKAEQRLLETIAPRQRKSRRQKW